VVAGFAGKNVFFVFGWDWSVWLGPCFCTYGREPPWAGMIRAGCEAKRGAIPLVGYRGTFVAPRSVRRLRSTEPIGSGEIRRARVVTGRPKKGGSGGNRAASVVQGRTLGFGVALGPFRGGGTLQTKGFQFCRGGFLPPMPGLDQSRRRRQSGYQDIIVVLSNAYFAILGRRRGERSA